MAVTVATNGYHQCAVNGSAVQSLTFMAWVNYTNSVSAMKYIIGTYPTGLSLKTNSTGASVNYGTNNSAGVIDNTGSAFPTSGWTHLAITGTFPSTSSIIIKGYFNGKLDYSGTGGGTYSDWTSIVIGNDSRFGGSQTFTSAFREVRIWYRELSQAEIQREAFLSAPVSRAALRHWLPFKTNSLDQGTGQLWTTSLTSFGGVNDISLPLRNPKRRRFIL